MTGVSVVIPLRNGARFIRETLQSVWSQDYQPLEIIVVDDGSSDGGFELVREFAASRPITLIRGEGRGAAAAMNNGMRRAAHPIICQIDQDVALKPGWIEALVKALSAGDVAAAQGIYVTDPQARLLSRVMNRDLEERYAAIAGDTDHVCTGNAAYRADALRQIGYFDEELGYGYDNDVSYRLRAAGYRLVISSDAQSFHRWRDDVSGYCRQQYGFGYGRLDVVAKHPRRVGGDAVSPTLMMLHPLLLLLSLVALAAGSFGPGDSHQLLLLGSTLIGALLIERTIAGVRAARRFHDLTPLWFPVVHLLRDVAWVCAIVVWLMRRGLGIGIKPSHSMRPPSRSASPNATARCAAPSFVVKSTKLVKRGAPLIIIPAFNEALNLPTVVAELRTQIGGVEILVVDDGSDDNTEDVVAALNVRSVRLPERMGVGTAVRTGLRYAVRQGFGIVARLDGDGQHRPQDVQRLLDMVRAGDVDIVFGNRRRALRPADDRRGLTKRVLAACLTVLTHREVLDPTCGLSAMGPRAVRLLAEQHPTGYPEAELRLLISRTTLAARSIAVDGRPRLSGKSTLTPVRLIRAAARVALAMYVVPFRPVEREPAGD